MTGYYQQRKEAIVEIDKMYADKKPIEKIIFTIEAKFGFTEKIVRTRIQHIENLIDLGEKK